MAPGFHSDLIAYSSINRGDPIFTNGLVLSPLLSANEERASLDKGTSWTCAVRISDSTYAGIALLTKTPDTSESIRVSLEVEVLCILRESTFQIIDHVLAEAYARAVAINATCVRLAVPSTDDDMTSHLRFRGFKKVDDADSEERKMYVAELQDPSTLCTEINRLSYDILANEYLTRSVAPGPSQESPETLAQILTSGLRSPIHRVLELGPGAGDVLAALTRSATETVGVELSPRMAAIAQVHAPSALIVCGDILSIDFGPESFDGIYAGAFLHLFSHSDALRVVCMLAKWVKRDGVVFVNTTVSNDSGEGFEIKSDYSHRVTRYRSRWTEEQFRSLLESNGLEIIERVVTDERERRKFWVGFLCRSRRISKTEADDAGVQR